MKTPELTGAELRCIARDAWTIRRLLLRLPNEPARGALGFCLPPFVAFHLVEALDWVRRHHGPSAIPRALDTQLRSQRASLKVFDTNRGQLEYVKDRLVAIDALSVEAFNRPHTGWRSIFRHIQPDLGLTFLDRHVVSTSHVGVHNAALPDLGLAAAGEPLSDPQSSTVYQYAVQAGKLVGLLTGALPDPFSDAEFDSAPGPPMIYLEDVRSRTFYSRLGVGLGLAPAGAAAFTQLLCQVNFVRHWLTRLLPPENSLLARSKFLTVFHAFQGLTKLTAPPLKRDAALSVLAAQTLSSSRSRWIRRVGAGRLRNVVAHYDLDGAPPAVLQAPDPLAAFAEHLSQHSSADLQSLLDEALDDLSSRFAFVITPSARGSRRVA